MNALIPLPLDYELNSAIFAIVNRVFPDGYDVGENAPGTWKELKAHLDAGNRMLVYSGGSEDTIYIDPAVNYAFRAWHDHLHWINDYDFSVDGEAAVCAEHCRVLASMARDEQQATKWCKIIQAEVIGQKLYHRLHNRFPDDQRGFVQAYLQAPNAALGQWW